jgi:tetratricopeptide (TPR) repeat protein
MSHLPEFKLKPIVLLSIVLIVITLAVYWQVENHQFLSYDDNAYVTSNLHVANGLTGQNIIWAVTSVEAGNWHPVTWLSHLADVQFYGMNPRGHHLTSVAIHTITSLILLILLFRMTAGLWQSFFVAAMFALHPLHIESVAWVAERKDVISAFFWFLTLFFYAEYAVKRKTSLYFLTLFSFLLGLMSKPMLVTLPIIMLLMDFWPLRRYRNEENDGGSKLFERAIALIKEKIPFFACSLLSGIITVYAQGKGDAIADIAMVSLRLRIENALTAYIKYIGKMVWPLDPAILYPLPASVPLWQVVSSLLFLLLTSAAAIYTGRRYPYFAAGWFWFLITLLPVIGIIQVGSQSIADRYTYIPLTGLFVMVAWGVSDLTRRMRHRQVILALLAGAAIISSAALTWQQLGYWKDNMSIYRQTLRVTSNNPMINCNLGNELALKGKLDEAIQEYWKALLVDPENRNTHYSLGYAYQVKGDLKAAIREYRISISIYHNDAGVHNNLGRALANSGDLDAAIMEYREALRINPNHINARKNLEQAVITTVK